MYVSTLIYESQSAYGTEVALASQGTDTRKEWERPHGTGGAPVFGLLGSMHFAGIE